MKKFTFLFTLLVVAAMLLAACGGSDKGSEGNEVPTGQATESTGAGTDLTAVPTTGTGSELGTATAPVGGESTPTVAAGTGGAAETPTVETGGAGGTGNLTQTPTAVTGSGAIPETGASAQYVLLSNILKMQVQGKDGSQVGNVSGVVIDRAGGVGTSGSSSSSASGTTGSGTTSGSTTSGSTTSSGSGAATATPTVSGGTSGNSGSTSGNSGSTSGNSGSTSGTTSTSTGETPRVAYVLVNVTGASPDNSSTGSTSGSTTSSKDAKATPTAASGSSSSGSSNAGSSNAGSSSSSSSKSGHQVLVPWQAFTVSGQGMGSVGSTASGTTGSGTTSSGTTSGSGTLTETPTVAAGASGSGTTGSGTTGSGTAGSGTTSGSSSMGQSSSDMVLVLSVDSSALASAPAFDASAFKGQVSSDVASFWSGQVAGIPTTGASSTTGEQMLIQGQIGSISVNGSQGENLGQVRDFVVDTTTGDIVYAVLSGGSTFQGKMYVVPVSEMTWQAGQGQGMDKGTFQLNVPTTIFSGAPSISSVDEIGNNTTWFSDINSYWSGNNK